MSRTSPAERLKTWLLIALVPPLAGQPLGQWLRLMRESGFDVDLPFWPRAGLNAVCSFLTTLMKLREDRQYGTIDHVAVPPPIFVLGHYRSGTTHLHNLLCVDRRFTFPTMFRLYNPYTFRTFEPLAPLATCLLPRKRIVDNMAWGHDMPTEDELALMQLTGLSPYMGFTFPRRWDEYQCYLDFRDVPADDVKRWQSAFAWFLKKLTAVDGRPLLLKSPPHTARIRLLLELFPDARFVMIHRDPYTVFRSSRQLIERISAMFSFQRPRHELVPDRVLRQYRRMLDAYFDQRLLVAPGRLCEVRFEDLERDALGQVEQIYAKLNLPSFADVRPALEQYVGTLHGYRKNEYAPLADDLRRQVADQWQRSFAEWNYPA
ncbi:MAG: sulfotransferase family protein [Gemmataceae bacterium]